MRRRQTLGEPNRIPSSPPWPCSYTYNYTQLYTAFTSARSRANTRSISSIRESVYGLLSNAVRTSPHPYLSRFFSRPPLSLFLLRSSRGSEASRLFRPDANALVKTDDDNVREEEGRGGKLARDGHSEITLDRSLSLTWL